MSARKKAFLCLLSVCLLLSAVPVRTHALSTAHTLSLSAQSAVLIEAQSGEIIFAKNENAPLPMASTTKIMTALTALRLASPERIIQTDERAVGVEGSSVYLIAGEELTLEQLLYALLLESANDAAAAIAIGLSGSIETFADEMNRVAEDMGLKSTHFTNPHGLDAPAHYTTALELALITQEALKNDLIRTIVSTYKTTIPHMGNNGVRLLVNHNRLLRTYDGCIGVKTGYTQRSGRTLVSAAERNGVTLIAVTLNAPDDWNDHTVMLNYGFTRYKNVSLCNADDIRYPLQLVGGKEGYVMLGNRESLSITLPTDVGEVTQSIECRHFEYAPITANDICGKVVFLCDINGDGKAEVVAETPLYALYTVDRLAAKKGFWTRLKEFFSRFAL